MIPNNYYYCNIVFIETFVRVEVQYVIFIKTVFMNRPKIFITIPKFYTRHLGFNITVPSSVFRLGVFNQAFDAAMSNRFLQQLHHIMTWLEFETSS